MPFPCHSGDGTKENKCMAPIWEIPKLNEKAQMSRKSCSCVHFRARTMSMWTPLRCVCCRPLSSGPQGVWPLIPAQAGVKCHWIMGETFLPSFVLGWTTATGSGRWGKDPLGFRTAPAVHSALRQRNKTRGCPRVYKVNWLTSTTMRHRRVSQSLAGYSLLWISPK